MMMIAIVSLFWSLGAFLTLLVQVEAKLSTASFFALEEDKMWVHS